MNKKSLWSKVQSGPGLFYAVGLCLGTAYGAFEDITFKAAYDGTEQRYVMDVPAGARDVMISLHGHGADRWQVLSNLRKDGDVTSVRAVAAARRMALCSPDYRAKTSWMGPAAEADTLQLIDILKKRFGGRIFLVGGSMGGSSTLTFASRHPELLAGIVAFNPLADHLSYTRFQDAIATSFGGPKDRNAAEFRARSALYFPERFTMPVSITLGGSDQVVPPDSARELAKKIAALNLGNLYVDEQPKRGHETEHNAAVQALFEMFRRADAVTVAYRGETVHPSHGSASGVWFYECGDAQLLLLGFSTRTGWRIVATDEGWTLNGKPAAAWLRADGTTDVPLEPRRAPYSPGPTPCTKAIAAPIADALVEWDWRCRDGLETLNCARPLETILADLRARAQRHGLAAVPQTNDESEWRALHRALRADILKRLPEVPILFVKHVPEAMSHQLNVGLGYTARPGGGLFVLEHPGRSMTTRDITPPSLPPGSYLAPDLSFDATRLLFSYAPVAEDPPGSDSGGPNEPRFSDGLRMAIHYSVYEMPIQGGVAGRLTSGDYEDLYPIYLPNDDILFSSTRRGGFHRCGSGPCPVHTLTRMGPRGENPHLISFHETHEWMPTLLDDGRLLYSRWDYCDRNAVLYQHLWTSRPDGGGTAIYYGNNTWNPCGTWEARPVPGSRKVMAIAGPHHAMAAGSVVLVDIEKGIDGPEPLTRLTPEVRFPESEEPVMRGAPHVREVAFDWVSKGCWPGGLLDPNRNRQPTPEEKRWPGESYKTPWPLSEKIFLASFTFDRLFGEPGGNPPNQYGLYICDADGVRELIYRDPRISSLWARPIQPRKKPPMTHSSVDRKLAAKGSGTFYLANVYDSWPKALPKGKVKALRIFRIINKTTPDLDKPKVAAGWGAFGREVLGTVPVEEDGSAYFEAPASAPLYFQALDARGCALQTMRSDVYLSPGVRESCTGCHEDRRTSSPVSRNTAALRRTPSKIVPGPTGSRPFNFLRLVQPVLDAKCVKCHDGTREKCPSLKGDPQGWACRSFNVLEKHVAWSGWNKQPNNNHEPLTLPLTFGALASPLYKRLLSGHGDVKFEGDEWERLCLWMDSNGACWGTFDKDRQRDL